MLEKRAYDCKCTYICIVRFWSLSPLFVYGVIKTTLSNVHSGNLGLGMRVVEQDHVCAIS